MSLIYAVINSGALVSGNIDLTKQALFGISVPTINSGDLLLQGGVDTTSANFLRLLEARAPGSGDMRFATGVGSRMVILPDYFSTPPYLRLEVTMATGSAQTNPRTFTLFTRPR
jgi:hypothetical protein